MKNLIFAALLAVTSLTALAPKASAGSYDYTLCNNSSLDIEYDFGWTGYTQTLASGLCTVHNSDWSREIIVFDSSDVYGWQHEEADLLPDWLYDFTDEYIDQQGYLYVTL